MWINVNSHHSFTVRWKEMSIVICSCCKTLHIQSLQSTSSSIQEQLFTHISAFFLSFFLSFFSSLVLFLSGFLSYCLFFFLSFFFYCFLCTDIDFLFISFLFPFLCIFLSFFYFSFYLGNNETVVKCKKGLKDNC